MSFFVAGAILSGNYVFLNKNISDGSKTGFFAVLLACGVLMVIACV